MCEVSPSIVISNETLVSIIVRSLIDKRLSIACAESCTGGLLTAGFVDYPGVSAVLAEGVVAYSNESKIARLGVTKQTLDKYGAVSAQTAAEMASGVAKTASAGVGISTTGIAGPGGGSYEKPVGLVYIGLSVNKRISTKELRLTGDRSAVRNKAVKLAMEFLLQSLKDI